MMSGKPGFYLQELQTRAACKQLVVNIVGHAQPLLGLLLLVLSCIPSYHIVPSLLRRQNFPSMHINHTDDQAVIILEAQELMQISGCQTKAMHGFASVSQQKPYFSVIPRDG
jgi:hypothetical protein